MVTDKEKTKFTPATCPSCGNGYGSYEEKVVNCHKSPAHQQGNVMLKFVCGNCGCIHYPSMGWKIESGSVWTKVPIDEKLRGSYRRGKGNTLDWIPEKKLCSKCRSEMEHAIGKKGTIAEGVEEWYCRKCGHSEDYVKEPTTKR
jgi:rubredoxin